MSDGGPGSDQLLGDSKNVLLLTGSVFDFESSSIFRVAGGVVGFEDHHHAVGFRYNLSRWRLIAAKSI